MNQKNKPEIVNLRDAFGMFQFQIFEFNQGNNALASTAYDATITIDASGPFVLHFLTTEATNPFTLTSFKIGSPATYTVLGQAMGNNAIVETLANSPIQAFIGAVIRKDSKFTLTIANGLVAQVIRVACWGYRSEGFWYEGTEY